MLKRIINKIRRYYVSKHDINTYVCKTGDNNKWVFISYIPEAIYYSFDDFYLNAHQSRREMCEIIHIFTKLGYNVYCSNFNNKKVPNIKFSVVFGIEPCFITACQLNPNAIKIYYATGAYSAHQNFMIKKRTDGFNEKNQSDYPYQRLVPDNVFLYMVDYILQIGSHFTVETYPTKYQSLITTIHQSSTINNRFRINDKNIDKIVDILWIGGSGEILKGLDLVFDSLGNTKYVLHVVGSVSDKFKSYYKKCRNIRYYGFIDVNSDIFVNICKKCMFLLYPSCTEGCPGAVINSMSMGVIPIVSKWAAFDEIDDYGYVLDDLTVEAINKAMTWVESLSKDQILDLSKRCFDFSRKMYNLDNFKREFELFLYNILQ